MWGRQGMGLRTPWVYSADLKGSLDPSLRTTALNHFFLCRLPVHQICKKYSASTVPDKDGEKIEGGVILWSPPATMCPKFCTSFKLPLNTALRNIIMSLRTCFGEEKQPAYSLLKLHPSQRKGKAFKSARQFHSETVEVWKLWGWICCLVCALWANGHAVPKKCTHHHEA